jgi:hypothetical protein
MEYSGFYYRRLKVFTENFFGGNSYAISIIFLKFEANCAQNSQKGKTLLINVS